MRAPCAQVVFTGILKLIDLEDELAAVLGHETGHVVARHAVRAPPCPHTPRARAAPRPLARAPPRLAGLP